MLTDEEYKEKAEKFMRELPYMKSPYNKRNWGNKNTSQNWLVFLLCSNTLS